MNTSQVFTFTEFLPVSHIEGEEVDLVLVETLSAHTAPGFAPTYCFEVRRPGQTEHVGDICLRIADIEQVASIGHISYEIDENHRGNHYAAKAARLLADLARRHGLSQILICVHVENTASNKTAVKLGAKHLDTVWVEEGESPLMSARHRIHRYLWQL